MTLIHDRFMSIPKGLAIGTDSATIRIKRLYNITMVSDRRKFPGKEQTLS